MVTKTIAAAALPTTPAKPSIQHVALRHTDLPNAATGAEREAKPQILDQGATMIMIIPSGGFCQSLGTVKASEFVLFRQMAAREYDEADAKWSCFVIFSIDLSRAGWAVSSVFAISKRGSDREYEFQTPAEWLSGDDLGGT